MNSNCAQSSVQLKLRELAGEAASVWAAHESQDLSDPFANYENSIRLDLNTESQFVHAEVVRLGMCSHLYHKSGICNNVLHGLALFGSKYPGCSSELASATCNH